MRSNADANYGTHHLLACCIGSFADGAADDWADVNTIRACCSALCMPHTAKKETASGISMPMKHSKKSHTTEMSLHRLRLTSGIPRTALKPNRSVL